MTLKQKPLYIRHRVLTGAPVAADNANLQTLYETVGFSRAGIVCRRWASVRVFVRLIAGTTVTLAPLEVVEAARAFPTAADTDRGFAQMSANIAGLGDGDFTDITVHGGLLFLRLHAVAGASTSLSLFVAGHEVAVARTGQE